MPDEVIVLTGIKETLDALKEFDKDAVRRFKKVINDELDGAQRDAQSSVDLIKNPKTNFLKLPFSNFDYKLRMYIIIRFSF